MMDSAKYSVASLKFWPLLVLISSRQKNASKFATSLYDVITIGIAKNINKYSTKTSGEIRNFIFSKVHTDENFP